MHSRTRARARSVLTLRKAAALEFRVEDLRFRVLGLGLGAVLAWTFPREPHHVVGSSSVLAPCL